MAKQNVTNQKINMNVDTDEGAINFLRGFIQSPEIRGFSGRDFTFANIAIVTLEKATTELAVLEKKVKELEKNQTPTTDKKTAK